MLIILYGAMSNQFNGKQQNMIEGKVTCGYREYARKYGHIVYMSPQNVSLDWEHCITNPKEVVKFVVSGGNAYHRGIYGRLYCTGNARGGRRL